MGSSNAPASGSMCTNAVASTTPVAKQLPKCKRSWQRLRAMSGKKVSTALPPRMAKSPPTLNAKDPVLPTTCAQVAGSCPSTTMAAGCAAPTALAVSSDHTGDQSGGDVIQCNLTGKHDGKES